MYITYILINVNITKQFYRCTYVYLATRLLVFVISFAMDFEKTAVNCAFLIKERKKGETKTTLSASVVQRTVVEDKALCTIQ